MTAKQKAVLANIGAIVIVLGAMAMAWALGGCSARVAHVTNLPAGVTEQQAKDWDAAVRDLHQIAVTTNALREAVVAVRTAGSFPDDHAYAVTLESIAKVDALQIQAAGFLRQSPNNFGASQKQVITANVSAIAQELQTLNSTGVTGIKDKASLSTVNTALANLTGWVSVVLNLTSK